MAKYSKKMQYLLDHIGYDKIVETYEDKYTTECVVKMGGDYLRYSLYVTSDGEWLVCEK